MWLDILSDQLTVVALVSHYLTNKLIGRKPLALRLAAFLPVLTTGNVCGISCSFEQLFPTVRQVTYALLTRLPLATLR